MAALQSEFASSCKPADEAKVHTSMAACRTNQRAVMNRKRIEIINERLLGPRAFQFEVQDPSKVLMTAPEMPLKRASIACSSADCHNSPAAKLATVALRAIPSRTTPLCRLNSSTSPAKIQCLASVPDVIKQLDVTTSRHHRRLICCRATSQSLRLNKDTAQGLLAPETASPPMRAFVVMRLGSRRHGRRPACKTSACSQRRPATEAEIPAVQP